MTYGEMAMELERIGRQRGARTLTRTQRVALREAADAVMSLGGKLLKSQDEVARLNEVAEGREEELADLKRMWEDRGIELARQVEIVKAMTADPARAKPGRHSKARGDDPGADDKIANAPTDAEDDRTPTVSL